MFEKKAFFQKPSWVTFTLGLGIPLLLTACIQVDEDPYNQCPLPIKAEATGIKEVFFSPYCNKRYANTSDTVSLSDFGFNFELEVKKRQNDNTEDTWQNAYPLTCEETFHIGNISNISVVLTGSFAGLPIGTDISYALITPDGKRISDLRNFENISVYFGSKLTLRPAPYSQLKTRIFVFFRNGNQAFMDSTSPYLKID